MAYMYITVILNYYMHLDYFGINICIGVLGSNYIMVQNNFTAK